MDSLPCRFLSFFLPLFKKYFCAEGFCFCFSCLSTHVHFLLFFYCSQGLWGFFLFVRLQLLHSFDSFPFLFSFRNHFRPLWLFFFFLGFTFYPDHGTRCDYTQPADPHYHNHPKYSWPLESSNGFSHLRPGGFYIPFQPSTYTIERMEEKKNNQGLGLAPSVRKEKSETIS